MDYRLIYFFVSINLKIEDGSQKVMTVLFVIGKIWKKIYGRPLKLYYIPYKCSGKFWTLKNIADHTWQFSKVTDRKWQYNL